MSDTSLPVEQELAARSATASQTARKTCGRRRFLIGGGALVAGGWGAKALYDYKEAFQAADVLIAKAESYEVDLVDVLRRGLTELGVGRERIRGKVVLLKPNLVEPAPEAPHINTHPAVLRAAAEVFRSWDARSVFVAEGQGHCRDSYLVLEQSGVGAVLDEAKLPFIDLNHDEVAAVPNRHGLTSLKELYLPTSLLSADVIVSMPKLKIHHWAGVTLSMKNLFGVMPGIVYGWPKNVLHVNHIGKSIVDINATVRPHLAIVDGIVGMEGDGPIMGDPKPVGVLVMGANFPAVDATAARIMGIDPQRVDYLAYSSSRFGPIAAHNIAQRGEPVAAVTQPFRLLDTTFFHSLRS